MTQQTELTNEKVIQISKLVLNNHNNKQQEINFENDLGKVIFVKNNDTSRCLEFLKCLAGAANPASGTVFYKQMNVHTFKKSYYKRGRVFIDQNANHCFKKSLFFLDKILYKKAFSGIKINPNKTTWKNLQTFAKINNNQEFCFAAVHYFLFHEIVDKKAKDLMPCEFELLKISTAMFFENIDLWIIYVDDEKITDEADIKIVRHLLHSRASDCEGLVFYTTKSGKSININNEEVLEI